ncbi:hypothetical protein LPJ61_006524 [Coemansia biformis]|uniref:HSF-type DNA-binding domain-containing protein n=1 Tax=Coemansia biformis TaxID=1286918 RepID=A0A9W7XQB1_9FUNG|nr:hypothetical protein LPJ61_006524 [Coemansia biformis]
MPPSSTNYRTSIHFLTSPSSATTDVAAAGGHGVPKVGRVPNSVPVSALLSPKDDGLRPDDPRTYSGSTFHGSESPTPPRRILVSLPPIHISSESPSYRDDELTGMAGLMELAGPPNLPRPADVPRYAASAGAATAHATCFGLDTHSSTASSNSTGSHSLTVGVDGRSGFGAFATPPYASPGHHGQKYPQMPHYYGGQHHSLPHHQPSQMHHLHPQQQQQQQQQAHAQRYPPHPAGAATLPGTGVPTPERMMPKATRSFPTTVDDMQISRRRSQSTDSMQTTTYGTAASALPQVLGNANIRNRSMTTAQRQRTSDTPLFPILLHRIINDPKNESWIQWCNEGHAFKFSSADNLLACLQAAGLRAQNYHSIEKNLNDYRFVRLTDQRRKIPDLDGKLWWMFMHPQFLRDNPDGIVNIQRRRRTNPPSLPQHSSAMSAPVQPPPQQPSYPAHPPGSQQGADGWV